ncbi:MAG: ferrochelatase [Propionicimonas sp.]|nr:ferrochelatase [Propionicimonas sp.]
MSFDALVMLGFGGPEHLDEVVPFLERVTAGRGIPPERLVEVGQHYITLGGVSPINAQNRRMRDELAVRLAERGIDTELVLANRNSPPFVPDVLGDLAGRGKTDLLAWSTAAYASYSGCRQYREDLGLALAAGQTPGLSVVKVPPFPELPGMAEAVTDLLAGTLAALGDVPGLLVMFTTHSIPLSLSANAGPEGGRTDGDLYSAQQLALAGAVIGPAAERAGLAQAPAWRLVYQSRSGAPHIPWLEPDINDALAEVAPTGVTDVVIVPIGFLTDHVEVIWDLDTQAKQTADELGLRTHRVPTVGEHPAFLDSLADYLAGYLTGEVRPPEPGEACFGDCCLNPRSQRPVAPGIQLV